MGIKTVRSRKVATVTLTGAAALFLVGVPAHAQSMRQAQDNAAIQVQANDSVRADAAQFREFLDAHPDVARQLQGNPSLLDNKGFVKHHSDLKKFLHDNPGSQCVHAAGGSVRP